MENLLIEIYLFVCRVYDTSAVICYQRLSNNRVPGFTDEELITIWFFAHLESCFKKKRMHRLIAKYWRAWFPRLPSYQTLVLRLNRLDPTLLFGDLTYPTPEIISHLKAQQTRLVMPKKKPKGKELTANESYYNRLMRSIRQPIESLFNWIEEKTMIQSASRV